MLAQDPADARADLRAGPRATVLARVVTEVLAPAVLTVSLLLLVGAWTADSWRRGLVHGLLAAFFAGLLPAAVLLVAVRRGHVGNRHVTTRAERPAVMALGLVSVVTGLVALVLAGASRELVVLVVAMAVGVLVGLGVSSFWKISIHTASAAGAVASLALLVHPGLVVTAPLVVLSAWSRVALGHHTVGQVGVGAAVGAVVATATIVVLQ